MRADDAVDFFVSYAASDQAWAEWVGWQLEAAGYRVILRAWDFGAGSNLVQETQRAISISARTLALLSLAYLMSAADTATLQAVWAADPTGAERRLVVVRLEDCPRPELLRPLIGLDLFGLDDETARKRLLGAAAAGRRKPGTAPAFPASAAPRFPGPHGTFGGEPRLSPFPGLAAFGASRAGVFRGREAESRRLADRLVAQAESGGLMVVVGPSGCGKSSLVAAGLVPRLAEEADWLVTLPMAPGDRPVTALAVVLAEAGRRHGLEWDARTLARRLEDRGEISQLASELLAATGRARWLLLVVDQAEELLVRASPGERDRFLALLAAADLGRVRVVATLRSEYLDSLLEATASTGLLVPAETVMPLSRDLLPLVIAEPARMSGLYIDDELVARMVADTGDGHALPLLAYTLQRLHLAAQAAGTHVLSGGLYEQIGGVQGALVEHADAALAAAAQATHRTRQEILAGLLRLVTVDSDGRPVRRRIRLDQLPDITRASLVPFVTRRLLVLDTTPGGPVTMEIAHERLLTAWPPLAQTIADDTNRLRQRAQAETAAADWQQAGRPAGQLWGYSRADSALGLLARDDLTPMARLFLISSRRHARRRLTAAFATLAILLVVATGLGITSYLQSQTADDRRRTAVADRLLTLADNARDTDPTAAMRLAVAAHDIAPEGQRARIRGNLLQTLAATPYLRTTVAVNVGPVYGVASGPGSLLATGGYGGTVRLWDTRDPTKPRPLGDLLTGHTFLSATTFGPDGLLATGGAEGTVRLWDTSDPAKPRQLGAPLAHTRPVSTVAFGPDGQLAAGGGDDGMVQVWDIRDPTEPRPLGDPLTDHEGHLNAVAFGPDGLLATASGGGVEGLLQLWDTRGPAAPRLLCDLRHAGTVTAVAFGPDGLLAAGGDDGTVRLWDTADPTEPHPHDYLLTGHTGPVRTMTFGPDGLLATGGDDGTVRLWDTADPTEPHPLGDLGGETHEVRTVAFGSDGLLAAGGDDGTVRLWDTADPTEPHPLGDLGGGTYKVRTVAFGSDGLLATGSDGPARLWDIRDPTKPHPLGGPLEHTGPYSRVAFGPDGLLATDHSDSIMRLWDTSDPASPRPLSDLPGHTGLAAVAFGPDGLLATGSSEGQLQLWDIHDPAGPRPLGDPLGAGIVHTVAFGPDGLLAAGDEGPIRLWDTSDPANPRRLGSPLHPIDSILTGKYPDYAVEFGPDGLLAIGGYGNASRLWDVGVLQDLRSDAIKIACQRAGRGLDEQEWLRYLPGEPFRNTCPTSAL
ncbi:hypothetical protein ACG83_13290 [Frankia sp. R43]|nr:hypothetical protein ACG83_13290 [Frankia sp. R43]